MVRGNATTHVFLCYYINYPVFSSNIEYPEAMIDDCLKSDDFHV